MISKLASKKKAVSKLGTKRVVKVIEEQPPLSVDDLVGGEQSFPEKFSEPAAATKEKTTGSSLSQANLDYTEALLPNEQERSFYRPMKRSRFDGLVDNRIIPDANVPTQYAEGILDTEIQNGHGLLRPNFVPSDKDIYISTSQIRRFSLRPGDLVGGPCRKPKDNERYWGLLKVEKVNGVEIDKLKERLVFEKLTPLYPNEQLKLETGPEPLSTRIIDLVAPIGKGQRGLIVSPPKAGKTTILKQIAHGITTNYKEIILMAVLVGERPEEVTDISRSVKGTVIASNFDEPPQTQTHIAEIALERAKRLVEEGKDVVLLLDSITRLARAYNLSIPTSGRTLSGGFDPAALYPPKRFFGAARNIENGGSLTIIATALIDTGSRMDDLIYEEFKGTGNMELHLSRMLEQRRVFPSIDLQKSGTRQEQLLLPKEIYQKVITMRRMLEVLNPDERTEIILERLRKTKNNKEFLANLNQG